ncbi:beta-N-acetylhexosaminidase [Streptomyces sp. NA04227]|uniref:beta-N-acetylhexosaminidase n=1 Tax=Streptomyces sp. NA04227 TaxID=2742136 RepID=UPI0020CA98AB|nr:beta-N-acetylhexosaminidase [Streptomyces sp. NA04227]
MTDDAPLPLVPLPRHVRRGPGHFRLDSGTVLRTDRGAEREAAVLRSALAGAGLPLPPGPGADPAYPGAPADARTPPPTSVWLRFADPGADGEEAYRIEVTERSVTLTARGTPGLGRAVQTLRQLLPPAAHRRGESGGPWPVPCCTVVDAPRFAWRGLLLDVARHFLPKDAVLRMLDLAALHRLSHVQLHLTDDQGWRLDVPGRPRLREVAAWRDGTLRGHASRPLGTDPSPHGGCYSRADLAEIQAYARHRHLTLVPEVDLPGHMQAALAAYPELGVTGPHPVATGWGVSDHVLAPSEAALAFCKEVLDEVFEVFDAPVVHLGGDECPTTEWRASAPARARAAELGLDSVAGLQGWFHTELAAHARRRGRRTAGWDEMTEGPWAPPDAVVTAWRDWLTPSPAATALAAGHDVVLCPASRTYLDHYQSDLPEEPLAQGGLTTWQDLAGWDPLEGLGGGEPAHGLGLGERLPGVGGRERLPCLGAGESVRGLGGDATPPSRAGRVLGVQAQLWSEYLPTPAAVDYAAFPRLGAFAEAAWTGTDRRAAEPLAARMPGYLALLDALGVRYRPLEGPAPWQRGGSGPRARPEVVAAAGTVTHVEAPRP